MTANNNEHLEKNKEIKTNNDDSEIITDIPDQTKKDSKLHLNWKKMIWMWPSIAFISRKAKKINRKNKKEADYYSEEYRYHWVKKVVNRLIKIMDIEIKVEGIENWLDRGVILVPNHQSNFDPAILLAINDFQKQQPLAFIAKQELWSDKKFKNFVNLIDCVPLNRKSPRSALVAFKEAKDLVVDYKRSLVIFPEGTRSTSNKINEFHNASIKIAQMSNAPIIPVTFINSYLVFNKRKGFAEVKVIFGKPIMPKQHLSLSPEVLTKTVKRQIQDNMNKWIDKEPTYTLKILRKQKSKPVENKKPKQKKKFRDIFKVID